MLCIAYFAGRNAYSCISLIIALVVIFANTGMRFDLQNTDRYAYRHTPLYYNAGAVFLSRRR